MVAGSRSHRRLTHWKATAPPPTGGGAVVFPATGITGQRIEARNAVNSCDPGGARTMSRTIMVRSLRISSAIPVIALMLVAGIAFAQAPAPAPAPPAAAAPAPPPKPDPGGTATGGIADVTAKTAGKPTLEEVGG